MLKSAFQSVQIVILLPAENGEYFKKLGHGNEAIKKGLRGVLSMFRGHLSQI